jgi:hypothetical protein
VWRASQQMRERRGGILERIRVRQHAA